jgi:hypothetical protein
MAAFIEALLRFFHDFSGRRALGLLAIVVIIIGGFLLYDRYTASFTLGRLEHAADLITKLQAIESSPTKRTPELEAAYQSLRTQVSEAISSKPITISLPPPKVPVTTSQVLKFICGALPWFLISLTMLPKAIRGDATALGGFFGVTLFAIFFGFVALLIPTFWWPWGSLILYPLLHPIFVLVVIAAIGMRMASNKNKKDLQSHE